MMGMLCLVGNTKPLSIRIELLRHVKKTFLLLIVMSYWINLFWRDAHLKYIRILRGDAAENSLLPFALGKLPDASHYEDVVC